MSQTTANSELLIRSEVWDAQLKEIILDELNGYGWVNWIDFPDGTTWTRPSVGQATVRDYVEDNEIQFDALDQGEFQLTVTDYKSAANYITDKNKQDSYYAAQLEASFVPKQARALQEVLESSILGLAAAGASGGQTVSDLNTINGGDHRWTTAGTTGVIQTKDFAKVVYSLKKANVGTRVIGIVDPSVEYQLNTLTNIVDVSNNPRWEGIIADGLVTDMKFMKSVYGIDLYVSNRLPAAGAAQDGAETIDSVAIASGGVCNAFFSIADTENLPFIGAWRQQPTVEGFRNTIRKRDEYSTTARYGLKVYRPENLVVVINNSGTIA